MDIEEDFERRQRVVGYLRRADDLIRRAINDGSYHRNETVGRGHSDLAEYEGEYRDLTTRCLDEFRPGEESVALWTQIELYSSFVEPALLLQQGADISRATLPRVEMLVDWASGKSDGPEYEGHMGGGGDALRHSIVAPQSGGPPDMIWAPLFTNPPEEGSC